MDSVSCLTRSAHNACQIVMEWESYRKCQCPGENRSGVRPRLNTP